MNAKKIQEFLAKNPVKVKTEKKTVNREKVAVDKYGLRVSSHMAAVNQVIADFVTAGYASAVNPATIAKFCIENKITEKDENRIKGHVSWFLRNLVYHPTKRDFVRKNPVIPVASAITTAPETTTSKLHLA